MTLHDTVARNDVERVYPKIVGGKRDLVAGLFKKKIMKRSIIISRLEKRGGKPGRVYSFCMGKGRKLFG